MIYDYCMGYSAEIDGKREDLVKQFQLLKDAVQMEMETQSSLRRLILEFKIPVIMSCRKWKVSRRFFQVHVPV